MFYDSFLSKLIISKHSVLFVLFNLYNKFVTICRRASNISMLVFPFFVLYFRSILFRGFAHSSWLSCCVVWPQSNHKFIARILQLILLQVVENVLQSLFAAAFATCNIFYNHVSGGRRKIEYSKRKNVFDYSKA